MRVAPAIVLNPDQKAKLEQQARARSLSARLVERSRIVLLASDGQQDIEIAAKLGITPKKAARWRDRFRKHGLDGLLKDAPRPGRKRTITAKLRQKVIAKTTKEKPDNATHWSTRAMATAMGISEASVRRIWHAHGLKPSVRDSTRRRPATHKRTR